MVAATVFGKNSGSGNMKSNSKSKEMVVWIICKLTFLPYNLNSKILDTWKSQYENCMELFEITLLLAKTREINIRNF
jgi:hypothetical protein